MGVVVAILNLGFLAFMVFGISLAVKGIVDDKYRPEDFDNDEWP